MIEKKIIFFVYIVFRAEIFKDFQKKNLFVYNYNDLFKMRIIKET